MGSKIEYVESSHIYATNYIRNAKSVGVLWAIFTICYAIIITVAFITPEWIGTNTGSESIARFGLWNRCQYTNGFALTEECSGHLENLSASPLAAFKNATICGGLAVFFSMVTVFALLLFFFFRSTTVFCLCGWTQILSAGCLIGAVVLYPMGWDSEIVKEACGPDADSYSVGNCNVRWAYVLAMLACLDALVLASLALILASRHVKLQPEPFYGPSPPTLYKGELNGGYMDNGVSSLAGSRKSLNLRPVLLMPQPMGDADRYSDASGRTNGRSTLHNFQL